MYHFSVRTESALWMHGPRGAEFSELRASAVKGVMRYWFRAFGGLGLTLDELHTLEGNVFGRAGERRARLSLLLKVGEPYKEISTKELSPLPHKAPPPPKEPLAKEQSDQTPTAAATETGAGERERGGKNSPKKKIPPRALPSAVKPGSHFEIFLSRNDQTHPALEEVAAWSLWLALQLGGLGSRMRRGAGSTAIEQLTPALPGYPGGSFASHQALAEAIQHGLKEAHRAFREVGLRRSGAAGDAAHPLLSPERERSRIVVASLSELSPETSESDARSHLWLKLRAFKNPAFGLPLKLPTGWVKPQSSEPFASHTRHASPVWFHLTKSEQGWAAVVTFIAPCPQAEGGDVQRIHDFLGSFGENAIEVEIP